MNRKKTAPKPSISDLLPPPLPEKYEAIKAVIADHGVAAPIIVDQEGNFVQGYNRWKACHELGIS